MWRGELAQGLAISMGDWNNLVTMWYGGMVSCVDWLSIWGTGLAQGLARLHSTNLQGLYVHCQLFNIWRFRSTKRHHIVAVRRIHSTKRHTVIVAVGRFHSTKGPVSCRFEDSLYFDSLDLLACACTLPPLSTATTLEEARENSWKTTGLSPRGDCSTGSYS